MSFGPERAGRRAASVDSPIARTTRRILLTGGCAFAGWIGASALGGAAHAATVDGAAPVSSVLNSVSATSQQIAGGATQHRTAPTHDARLSVPTSLAGIHRSVDAALGKTAIGRRPSSITIRPATDLPGAPKPSRQSSSGNSSSGNSAAEESAVESLPGIGDALSSGDQVGGDIDSRLHALDPAVKPVTDKVIKPVAEKVVEPIASRIKPATDQIVAPVTDRVVKPVTDAALHATQMVAVPGSGDGALAGLGGTLDSLTGNLHDLTLPGLSQTGTQQPAPIALNPRPVDVSGRQFSLNHVVRSGAMSADRAASSNATRAAHSTAGQHTTHPVGASVVPAQRLLPAYATAVAGSGSQHDLIAVSGASRAPNGPVAPAAPQLPTGASIGSAPGSSMNNSGPTGGSPVALDSDADAPFRALGTVDPTDASMARSVAKRPSTSPD
ncbi:MAG TPA: hypothetical protein VHX59_27025 [Mycobacteriales bacterium]|jgi:hypothetical protein|nr:hypothetical protein [Mycobacteriales bacterium]